jgi:L-asparaginase
MIDEIRPARASLPESDYILFLTTGGTIDKDYFDVLSEYKVGDPTAVQILAIANATCPISVKEVLRKDSLDMTEGDVLEIVRAVTSSGCSRVVITHGTDRITSTAARLSEIPGKTIVLTGAFRPARFTDSDAPFNIGAAIAAVQFAPPGVYIAINGLVIPAAEARKDRAAGHFLRDVRG